MLSQRINFKSGRPKDLFDVNGGLKIFVIFLNKFRGPIYKSKPLNINFSIVDSKIISFQKQFYHPEP